MVISAQNLRIYPGKPYPLGATWDGLGVNVALFSEQATKVELCLFDSPEATQESARLILPEYTNDCWHGYFPDLRPGQVYGFRVYGPYNPQQCLWFNPNKVLVDPYAKAIVREITDYKGLYAYQHPSSTATEAISSPDSMPLCPINNAATAPLGVIIDDSFTWGDDRHPQTPWHKTIIYEAHVKGLTKLHPDIPSHLQGTYAGVASLPVINHLKSLGVTAIELMPVHHHLDEPFLLGKNLTNYWGYNTLSFFAPDNRYSAYKGPTDHVQEFKTMVRSLHAAGIEVILDVVYNHTAEGNHWGPMLSFKGIDNLSYYKTVENQPQYYQDYTGCGNTLNMRHPRVLQLLMDSLRYWVQEMHVDGFRFDLASALARELYDVDKLSSFFDVIQQDPIISQVKLIAEPWDIGAGGYQVGNFPTLWTEWNGKYRDNVRSFWRGDSGQLAELASRITGSSDLYEHSGRRPHASINYVTCHDGFSLTDLVSYRNKHNEANGEDNRDGDNNNHSDNYGAEGPTEDVTLQALRYRQKRNLFATLAFSIGVPMISGGDELGRTQQGNNNAYCQDSPLAWYPWNNTQPADLDFLAFCRKALAIRQAHPIFQRRRFFKGELCLDADKDGTCDGPMFQDVVWLHPYGRKMAREDWQLDFNRCIGIMFEGYGLDELSDDGKPIVDDTLLLLINAHNEGIPFSLPTTHPLGKQWELLLDTALAESGTLWQETFPLRDHSISLLRLVTSG
ncbi:MAG: glycogen debranching protein GlgX [Vampirovibrionales bacterium]